MLLSTLSPPHRKTHLIHRKSSTSLASRFRPAFALCTPPSSGRVSALSTVPELLALPDVEARANQRDLQVARLPHSPPSTPPSTPPSAPPKQAPDSDVVVPALVNALAPGPRLALNRRRSRDANDRSALKRTAVGRAPPIMADRYSAHSPTRDSHEISLSLRDVTRDSLVANMLMSLDQLSFGDAGSAQTSSDHGPADAHEHYGSRPWTDNSALKSSSHRRGHKLSLSSDLESTSTQKERGRGGIKDTLSYRNRPSTPPRRSSHNRGGKHSNKSSSSASVDLGHSKDLVSERLARTFGRSSSFDYDYERPQARSPTHLQKSSASSSFKVDFPDTYDEYEYGAAPTPTVPSGPRRDACSIPIPPPPPEPTETRTLDRKKTASTRSLKSASGRSRRGASHQTLTPAPALAAMSPEDLESAPAPSVGYGKSKEPETFGVATSQVKERPGFFRRVFGSSKGSGLPTGSLPVSQSSAAVLPSPIDRAPPQLHQQQMQPKTSAPPSRDTSSSHSHQHPPLQKKSSSFFRRRKKSVVDDAPPVPQDEHVPPMPTMNHATPASKKQDQTQVSQQGRTSPTSSLREIMNPYLRDGDAGLGLSGVATSPLADITNKTPERGQDISHDDEYKRDFSPEYVPSPKARIRTVQSGPEGERFDDPGTSSKGPSKATNKSLQTTSNSFLNLDGGTDVDGARNKTRPKRENGAARDYGTIEDRDATIRAKKGPYLDAKDGGRLGLGLPRDDKRSASLASGSTETDYKTAPSVAPSVQVDDTGSPAPPGKQVLGTLESINACESLDEPEFIVGDPTEDDKQKAQKIFDGSSEFIQKDRAAAWMGEQGPVRQRTLQAYMELYDFTGLSIVNALRKVCGRLVMRGETQQVDRILVAFSKRWCSCNPRHGFKATDVIHMICYSIMLLNTDLHLADIEQKMTRSQFIKNTMTTISQAITESAPEAFVRPSILPEKSPLGGENGRGAARGSFVPPSRTETNLAEGEDSGPLVSAPFTGSMRAWQEQVEMVLKAIYASIRDERLPLFGAEVDRQIATAASQGSLSVMGMMRRSPSVLSKTPSETALSTRGRVAESNRSNTSRWTSKSRSRPGLGRTGFSSSRTSFDDGNSMWSPAMSSATWSKHSLGRTQASISQDSFGSSMPRGDYQQSIGFANALSQAIVRDVDANGIETAPSIMSADMSSAQWLEDESLELTGPPWVKEGMAVHKHHLDGVGKKAKDRHWTEVFAVIQKGQLSLFSFSTSKSVRNKSRSRATGKHSGPVGGGNWQDNAVMLGTFNLRLTLASALPSPGYSRSRPHVWALSLPTGAVHLFQVGTLEIIREFVNTANYWSARLSTHPLVGGISNVEYGWSNAIVNNALVSAINESTTSIASAGKTSRPESRSTHGRKSSVASVSLRGSSFDQVANAFTNNSGRGKLPGDKIHISDWSPPTQSMRPSNASETEQLQVLSNYVKGIEDELQNHNQLRSPMLLAFTPRGHNAGKAMANWERKSAYLLREIVKFRTYVDCLQQAENRKREIYSERALAQRAARGELSDDELEDSGDEGDETLRPQ